LQGLLSCRSWASLDWRPYGPTGRVETQRLLGPESRREVSMASLIGIAKKEATGECVPQPIGMNRLTGQAGRANEAGLPASAVRPTPVLGAVQTDRVDPAGRMVRMDLVPVPPAAVREVQVLEAPRARMDREVVVVGAARNGLGVASKAVSSVGPQGVIEVGRRTDVKVRMASADAIEVSVLAHSSPVFRMAIIAIVRASDLVAAKDASSVVGVQ
jgi:hypothetical protein